MTGYRKVFLDTAPIIYFLDNDVNFGEKAKSILEEILGNGKGLATSVILVWNILPSHIGITTMKRQRLFLNLCRIVISRCIPSIWKLRKRLP